MKFGAVILVVAFLGFSAFAGARVVVPSLPEAAMPLAEVETNVVFSTGVATDNKWTLTIERDAATSNCVEVVFGRDANEDGVLGIEEGRLGLRGVVLARQARKHGMPRRGNGPAS